MVDLRYIPVKGTSANNEILIPPGALTIDITDCVYKDMPIHPPFGRVIYISKSVGGDIQEMSAIITDKTIKQSNSDKISCFGSIHLRKTHALLTRRIIHTAIEHGLDVFWYDHHQTISRVPNLGFEDFLMELGDYLIAKSGGGVRLVEDTMTEGLIARVMERRKAELNNVRTGINTYPYLPTQYWIYDIPALKFEI